jgi:hypothetical protein
MNDVFCIFLEFDQLTSFDNFLIGYRPCLSKKVLGLLSEAEVMLGQIKLREEIASRLEKARLAAGYDSVESLCEQNNIPLKTYCSPPAPLPKKQFKVLENCCKY